MRLPLWLPCSPAPLLLCSVLAACTLLPSNNPQSETCTEPCRSIRDPKSAVILPQPTGAPGPTALATRGQIVEIRISHVQDLGEVLVQAGDRVEVGQVLARLEGYAAELAWDVRLSEEHLAEAQARLAAAHEDAASAHEQQMAEAAARVTTLERQVAALQRQKQIADVRLAEARATTEYRQRWLDTLKPLQEFDPWGDLPYLVGSQSGPQGLRSDLAYREALAKAEYDLRLAELARQAAGLEVADATAQLEQTQADLEAARANLERLKKSEEEVSSAPPLLRSSAQAVRITELRLARARAELEKTVVKSLVVGKVLDVRVDRVDGNDATVIIRVTAERNE